MHVGLATGFAYQGRESGSDAEFIRRAYLDAMEKLASSQVADLEPEQFVHVDVGPGPRGVGRERPDRPAERSRQCPGTAHTSPRSWLT